VVAEKSVSRAADTGPRRSIIMHLVDTDDNKAGLMEQEITEERFFELFAALEESLALLQIHLRGMSETVQLFGSLATHIRRSVRPAAQAREETRRTPGCGPRSR
jgi:hypothetical protein